MDAKIKGEWNQMQGRIKKAWGELTDDDIAKTDGDLDKLVGLVQEKYGEAARNAKQQLAELIQGLQTEDGDDDDSSSASAPARQTSVSAGPTSSRLP